MNNLQRLEWEAESSQLGSFQFKLLTCLKNHRFSDPSFKYGVLSLPLIQLECTRSCVIFYSNFTFSGQDGSRRNNAIVHRFIDIHLSCPRKLGAELSMLFANGRRERVVHHARKVSALGFKFQDDNTVSAPESL